MEATREGLLRFVSEMAAQRWADGNKPFFFSEISPLLKARNVNYRDIIGAEVTLKRFLRENAGNGFRVVQHPTKSAHVAAVPITASFEFAAPKEAPDTRKCAYASRRKTTLEFLRVLSELESSDIEKVVIPVGVLLKLLADK